MSKVLVTGGGKRLGRNISLMFAKKGWDVAIHYNESSEGGTQTVAEIISLGRKSFGFKADFNDSEIIEDGFTKMIDEFGVPDVLVNNAGIFPEKSDLLTLKTEDWDKVMNINLRAPMIMSKLFASRAPAKSKIINIASLGGIEVWKHRIPYNVSKAALIRLTEVLARELAPEIQVNCIAPGSIIIPNEPGVNEKSPVPIERILAGRHGSSEDIFEAVYFFATCTDFITGQILTVDGGNFLTK